MVAGSHNACVEGIRPSWHERLRPPHSIDTRGNFGTSPSNGFWRCVAAAVIWRAATQKTLPAASKARRSSSAACIERVDGDSRPAFHAAYFSGSADE